MVDLFCDEESGNVPLEYVNPILETLRYITKFTSQEMNRLFPKGFSDFLELSKYM